MSDALKDVAANAPPEEAQDLFVEVLPRDDNSGQSQQHNKKYTQAYIARVPPKECGALVKRLGKLQKPRQETELLPVTTTTDLSHLRRVRRRKRATKATDQNEQNAEENQAAATATATATAAIFEPAKSTKNSEQIELDVVLGQAMLHKKPTEDDLTI